ncbi:MAG TPA: tetratricopeptide repeat protein [Puia sp.]|nr:tetratricopeptide repeat protein [Puia sp.]
MPLTMIMPAVLKIRASYLPPSPAFPLRSRLLRVFAFLLACITCQRLAAQNDHAADSLWRIIKSGKPDTNQVTALLSWGDRYNIQHPDSAVLYYEKAHALARQLHWSRGIAGYDSHIVKILNDRGNYQQALRLCQEALRIYTDSGTREDQVRAYNNVANEYQYLGALSTTVDNYLKAMRLAGPLPNRRYMKILSNNLASVFYELGQYDKCYTYALQSYHIAGQLKDTEGIASSLVNLGLSETHLGRNDSAMRHFREIVQVGRRLDDYTLLCDAYVNIASIYIRLHNTAMAKPKFDSVLLLGDKYDNPNYRMLGLAGLADVATEEHNWPTADRYTKAAMEIARALRDRDDLVQLYDKEATVREKMLDWKGALAFRNQFDSLNDSLLNEKTRDHINDLETRYQTATKDHALAEQHLQLERTQEIVRRRNTQLYLLTGGLAALAILLLLAWRLFRQRQKLNRQALITLQKDQEVTVLKAVLQGQEEERQRIARELHDDMGAGLTTILYLSQRLAASPTPPAAGSPTPPAHPTPTPLAESPGSPASVPPASPTPRADPSDSAAALTTSAKIATTATGLVDTMNEIIWSMNQQYDTLEDLVAFIRRQASQILDNNGLDYHIDIPDHIPDVRLGGELRRNVYLVVKEALNNALKHAGASLINLRIDIDNRLHVLIQDNGRGMPCVEDQPGSQLPAEGPPPHDPPPRENRHHEVNTGRRHGNGLRNMQRRMQRSGGSISIVSNNGTTVQLSVPI